MKNKFLYNNRDLRERRRELRNNPTEAERILWAHLSKKQIKGFRFLRQYGVGPYILDFYCPKLRLAIELDGAQHTKDETRIYDKERSEYLETEDIRVIRFWNDEVLKDIEGVIARVPLLR